MIPNITLELFFYIRIIHTRLIIYNSVIVIFKNFYINLLSFISISDLIVYSFFKNSEKLDKNVKNIQNWKNNNISFLSLKSVLKY